MTDRVLHWRDATGLLPFDELEEGDVDQRHVFGVRSDRCRSQQTGAELTVDRLITRDWVNVVAIADEGDGPFLLCVRQYRFGIKAMSLEIPAGLVDPGEPARDAGLRELREETGYVPAAGSDVVDLGFCHPNAAFMGNRMSSFFVPRAVKAHDLDLDEHEEIEVVKVPLGELDEVVASGLFTNAAVLVALFWWDRHRRQEAA
jgi:ADP-ribose pyrophosphatase